MNKIYWDKDKISILTNQIEAVKHKHWAIQVFLSIEKDLELYISGKLVKCKCVVVNKNVYHSFSTEGRMHFSIIIEPTSNIAKQLENLMNDEGYCVFDTPNITEVQELVLQLVSSDELNVYCHLIEKLYYCLGLSKQNEVYDNRIKELLQHIEYCSCDVHTISSFADKVALSSSRLSHLFREQVGMPLKNYIQFHQIQKAFLAVLNGKNITEAALLANFDTPSHFAAVTKKMIGMSASTSLKDSVFLKVYDM